MKEDTDDLYAHIELINEKLHYSNLIAIANDQIALSKQLARPRNLNNSHISHSEFFDLVIEELTEAIETDLTITEKETELISTEYPIEHKSYFDILQNLIEHKIVAYKKVEFAIRAARLPEPFK